MPSPKGRGLCSEKCCFVTRVRSSSQSACKRKLHCAKWPHRISNRHQRSKGQTMKSFLHMSKITLMFGGALSALVALVLIVAAQFHSDIGMLTLNFGDSHTKLGGVFDGNGNAIGGFLGGLLVFVALWFTLIVSFIVIVFATGIVVGTLGLVALVLAMPLLMLVGAVLAALWLIARLRARAGGGSGGAQLA
jgi:hypothetical protein